MTSQTRNQEYKYQYKMISIANKVAFCGFGPRINMAVPDNLLDIKALYVHVIFEFNSSTPIDRRKIIWIGGKYDMAGSLPEPTADKLALVNVTADSTTRIADVKIDITHLKDAVLFADSSENQPSLEVDILTNLSNDGLVSGKVILWKMDLVYTTRGIQ